MPRWPSADPGGRSVGQKPLEGGRPRPPFSWGGEANAELELGVPGERHNRDQANQYHHEISTHQRAAVAALLVPEIAEMVARGRLEKVRTAWEAKCGGGCSPNLANNLDEPVKKVDARAIVARMMRVSSGYVGNALRIQREAPELFEQLHAGTITIQAALKILNGEADDAKEREIRAARSEFNRALRSPDGYPDFLKRFREFMAQFAK